jgi:hypothetical protein
MILSRTKINESPGQSRRYWVMDTLLERITIAVCVHTVI